MIKKIFIFQLIVDIVSVLLLIKFSFLYLFLFINLLVYFKVPYSKIAIWKSKRYLNKISKLNNTKKEGSQKVGTKINKLISKRRWLVLTFGFRDKNGIYWFFDDILNRDRNYNIWSRSNRFKLFFKLIGE